MKTLWSCLVLLIGVQPAIAAQTFLGIAGGLNYSRLAPQFAETYTHGFAAQVSMGRQFGSRFGARLDAFTEHFTVQELSPLAVACPLPGCPPTDNNRTEKPLGVAAIRANGFINVDPPGPGLRLYLISGGGVYYFYQHPTIEGSVRPAVSAGAGVTLSVLGESQIFVEGVYNRILGASSQPTWLLPQRYWESKVTLA